MISYHKRNAVVRLEHVSLCSVSISNNIGNLFDILMFSAVNCICSKCQLHYSSAPGHHDERTTRDQWVSTLFQRCIYFCLSGCRSMTSCASSAAWSSATWQLTPCRTTSWRNGAAPSIRESGGEAALPEAAGTTQVWSDERGGNEGENCTAAVKWRHYIWIALYILEINSSINVSCTREILLPLNKSVLGFGKMFQTMLKKTKREWGCGWIY